MPILQHPRLAGRRLAGSLLGGAMRRRGCAQHCRRRHGGQHADRHGLAEAPDCPLLSIARAHRLVPRPPAVPRRAAVRRLRDAPALQLRRDACSAGAASIRPLDDSPHRGSDGAEPSDRRSPGAHGQAALERSASWLPRSACARRPPSRHPPVALQASFCRCSPSVLRSACCRRVASSRRGAGRVAASPSPACASGDSCGSLAAACCSRHLNRPHISRNDVAVTRRGRRRTQDRADVDVAVLVRDILVVHLLRCGDDGRGRGARQAPDQWASCANASLKYGSFTGSSARLRRVPREHEHPDAGHADRHRDVHPVNREARGARTSVRPAR